MTREEAWDIEEAIGGEVINIIFDYLEKKRAILKREDEELLYILQNGVKSGNKGQSLASMQAIKVLQDRIERNT